MSNALPPSNVKYSKVDAYVSRHHGSVEIEREGVDEEGNELEPLEIELEYAPDEYLLRDSLTVHRTPTGYLVGYLAHDEDCESPEYPNNDGAGMIGTCNRHDGRELQERFQKALGLNSDWSRKVTGWDLVDEIANDVFADRPDKNFRDLLRNPDHDWNHDVTRDDLKLTYRRKWDLAVKQHEEWGDFGDPDRVMLSVYEHGGRVYAVGDGSHFVDQQWDVSSGGAVWVPNDYLRNEEAKGLVGEERHAMMVTWAGQLVESMNDWMAGRCYGVIVNEYDFDGNLIDDNRDECWGYIGDKYAEQELADRVKWALMTEEEREAERKRNDELNRVRMAEYTKKKETA